MNKTYWARALRSARGESLNMMRGDCGMLLLNTVTVVFAGLLVGTELTVSIFVNPVLWKLDKEAQAKAISLFAAKLGAVMPFWYILTFALLLLETFIHRHGAGRSLYIGASVIWAAVIVFTLIFLVPINNEMVKLEGPLTDSARQKHKRWDNLHHKRIGALTASLLLFVLGTYR